MKRFVLFAVLAAVLLSACAPKGLTPKTTDLSLPFGYLAATFKDEVLAEEIIAVSFTNGMRKEIEPLYVMTSLDGGESWNETVIDDRACNANFLSFSSEKNGCLVIQGEYGMARQGEASVFVTCDSGITWQEVTSTTSVCNWLISDVLFISQNVGFVCYDYNAESQPVFCRTNDGGMSWEKVLLQTEDVDSKKASYANIESAKYQNGVITFSVRFYNETSEYLKNFISTDLGKSFKEEK